MGVVIATDAPEVAPGHRNRRLELHTVQRQRRAVDSGHLATGSEALDQRQHAALAAASRQIQRGDGAAIGSHLADLSATSVTESCKPHWLSLFFVKYCALAAGRRATSPIMKGLGAYKLMAVVQLS